LIELLDFSSGSGAAPNGSVACQGFQQCYALWRRAGRFEPHVDGFLTVNETYDTIIEIVLAGAEALLKRATPLLCELAISAE
jgi:hypothetical protein